MNEFEWRRQMRELREPVAPRHDLWNRIDAALEQSPAAAPARAPRASNAALWLLAASFAGLTLLAVGLGSRLQSPSTATLAATGDTPRAASWRPDDPRLAGAAIELDAAHMELRQALQQSPDSTGLQRLLIRTQQQQSRLRHLDRAG